MVLVRREYAEQVAEGIAAREVPGGLGFAGDPKPLEVSDLEVEIALAGGPEAQLPSAVKVSLSWFGRGR